MFQWENLQVGFKTATGETKRWEIDDMFSLSSGLFRDVVTLAAHPGLSWVAGWVAGWVPVQ